MKLIRFHKDQDYGQDYYLQVLFTKRWALFQGSLSWSDYRSLPFLQIQFGMGGLMTVLFQCHRFGFSIGLFERTWKLTDFDSADGVA